MADLITRGLIRCGFPCTGAYVKKAVDGIGLVEVTDCSAFGQAGYTTSDHVAIHGERLYVWKNGGVSPVGGVVAITNPVQTPAS